MSSSFPSSALSSSGSGSVGGAASSTRKRGSDDTYIDRDETSSEYSSKRSRNGDGSAINTSRYQAAPSAVLHARSLPTFTTENELINLLAPFGNVRAVFITQHNHQAFIQMNSIGEAEAIVNYSAHPPGFQLRGRNIFLQYSNRREVIPSVPQQHQNNAMQHNAMAMGGMHPSAASSSGARGVGAPSKVLLLTVTNLRVPLTLDHIYQITRSFGTVLKIVTFTKEDKGGGDRFSALVQFQTLSAAADAKAGLEGKDIFSGCCHVSCQYSQSSELKIAQTGPRAWLNPQLYPNGVDSDVTGSSGVGGANAAPAGAPFTAPAFPQMAPFYPYGMAGQQQQQQNPYSHLQGLPGFGGAAPYGFGPQQGAAAMLQQQQGGQQGGQGCVILVNNLPLIPEVTCDSLFSLFGLYGDVQKVKILFAKRDTALVQYATPVGATLAIQHLNGATLLDRAINLTLSVHNDISMPKPRTDGSSENDEASQLSHNYANSKLHRYRGKLPNLKNIHAPSEVLHVANIPDGTNEETMKQVFGSTAHVQFFTNDPHMAFVRYPTTSDAILALMRTHNHRLNGRTLRVSFSKPEKLAAHSHAGSSAAATTAAPTNTATLQPQAKGTADADDSMHRRGDEDGDFSAGEQDAHITDADGGQPQ